VNDQTIDLYALFNLDREATSGELGLLVLARDADLENKGVPATDHRRRQLETAYGVLSEEATRRTYDDALGARLQLTWPELEHLGSFGELPDANLFPGSAQSPGQSPGQPQSQSPFGYPMGTPSPPTAAYPGSYPGGPGAVGSTAASSFGYPTGPVDYSSQVPAQQYGVHPYPDRPSAGLRLGMMLLDSLAAVSVAGVASLMFSFNDTLAAIAAAVVSLAYFIGLEAYTGATPVKHLFGYQVRDLQTGAKPSLEQSAKRYWWRIVGYLPVLGTIVAFVGMIVIGSSINSANQFIGAHDRWAGVEVVRKRNRA